MFTQPSTLAPLLALGLALVWTAWRPGPLPTTLVLASAALLAWAVAGVLRAQRRLLEDRLAQAERRGAESRRALERSEAQRIAAEAEARAAEQRYLLALRGSQDGLWEWDIASGAVLLSPRWKGMLGYESGELADSLASWRGCVHADDRALFDRTLARHLQGGGVDDDDPGAGTQRPRDATRFELELRLVHKDGSVRHVLSRGVALRDDGGEACRIVGVDTDVTRLHRVQAVLDAVAEGTAGHFGERFFAAMVMHFARALEVDCAFIAECVDTPPTRARTLAYWSVAEGVVNNFEFALPGTPCEAVLTEGRSCFHREGLAAAFPREAGFEAYLGMPIVASDGRVLGHLALLDKHRLGDEVLVDRVYRIFLARAAAEIERLQALARLALAAPQAVSS